MKNFISDFAIIGGDLRQIYMANELIKREFSVIVYGLNPELLSEKCIIAQSLNHALSHAKNIIGPIPFTKDKKNIVAQENKLDLTIENLKTDLTEFHTFFAGCIPNDVIDLCQEQNIAVYDFMKIEEIAIFNTIATTEGAIVEAITRHPSNLHKSKCLVLGYGKCAKTLTDKLMGLSADVTVCARSETARALAHSLGYDTITFHKLESCISDFEYVFNTVPSLVLGYEGLSNIKKESIIIDIASSPGGVDYEIAKKLGISAHLCLGLPGKYAPKASAEALVETLCSCLSLT